MSLENYLFTSESVSEGHPDKVCDQISDAVVDYILAREPEARTAIETAATTNKVVLMGEVKISEDSAVTPEEICAVARDTIRKIGYAQKGFHFRTCSIDSYIHEQSADIAQGVDAAENKDEGAGDQGIMFGYATDETPELMPAPILYAHRILRLMAEARHSGAAPLLQPDAKSQVTMEYRGGVPVRADTIVVSTQHTARDAAGAELTSDAVREIVTPFVQAALPEGFIDARTVWHVNPTGRFVIGGPDGDAGLTGRKIIVDTYGGAAPHGGGAFSGKDPTKVDRSAAYAARYLAKNVVAAGLAKRCLIQLSYAIGVAEPLAVYVDTNGTAEVDPAKIEKAIRESMSLTPRGIRTHLGLNRPIYQRTAAYGHFGRAPEADGGFAWERTDLAEALKAAV
ncbi:methionine adenosyltransferase [Paralimibaculum aggregatum]|uniref:S-adenosylmethionine synthase n=1 Tax=Paralimibaculum aggregatum TaxID=3036245 RepID=A0ABQ6LGQ0_9RHOB|nr:methionine adenosyltransferase [Limibaculum sp. NKW23]GMG82182.1 methionine adenosyltransferase [Limibaculum sp. NKW23]